MSSNIHQVSLSGLFEAAQEGFLPPKICGMNPGMVAEIRRTIAEPAALREVAARIVQGLKRALPSGEEAAFLVCIGRSAGPAQVTATHRMEDWDGSELKSLQAVIYLLLDPLDIDSKQATFLSKRIDSPDAIFGSLYKKNFLL